LQQFFETSQGLLAIGAILGAGCVTLGALIPTFTSVLSRRRSASDERSAAMQAVLALDDFVGSSYSAVHDTPEFNPMNEDKFVSTLPIRSWRCHRRIAWSSLMRKLPMKSCGLAIASLTWDVPLMRSISRLEILMASSSAGGKATVLAAQAMDLIDRLVSEYALRMPDKPDYYRQGRALSASCKARGKAGKAHGRRVRSTRRPVPT